MKIDRYKIHKSNRLALRSSIDGLGVQLINRQSNYSPRRTDLALTQLKKSASPVQTQQVKKQQPLRPVTVPLLQSPTASSTSQALETMVAQDSDQFSAPAYTLPTRPRRLVAGRCKKTRRMALRAVTCVLALVFLTGTALTWRGYTAAGKVLSGTTTVAALSGAKVAPTLLKGEGDGRVNVLLLGVGGPGHDGGDLTDTMILASVDPVNNTVALLSIPRDLWVKMPINYYGNSQKINAAYSAGKYQYLGKADQHNAEPAAIQAGLNNVDTVLAQVLGTNIDYHVVVNFAAFEQAVDVVNGVTVDVKSPLIDASMAWENNNNATLVPAGLQKMGGKEALLYARSRHSTSDFDRSERQRQLLVALKQKVLSVGTFSNPARLDGLASTFGKNIYSDLSTKAALRLYDIMKKVNDSGVQSLDLVTAPHNFVTTDMVGTASVVRPKLGLDAYSDIQAFIRTQFRDGYLAREDARLVVVASTARQTIAAQTMLKDYGYNVTGTLVGAVPSGRTSVVDLTGGKMPYTRNYLEKRYSTTALNKLPAGVVVPDGTQFVILVGE